MRGLDTNLLVRHVTDDDAAQAAVVRSLFRDMEAGGERLHVSCVVLCELSWTLRGYGYTRDDISAVLARILATRLFAVQDSDLVRYALDEYWQGRGDFADYLIGWQNRRAGCTDTVTFDGKLKKAAGFTLLS
jgi:predicted nucleic-acid-binding protein